MTVSKILKELEAYGDEQTKKTLLRHGAKEPFFGVNISDLKKILNRIPLEIKSADDRFKHTMNAFVIAIGSYIAELTVKAQEIAKNIGVVEVDMGDTSCKEPLVTAYIQNSH